MDRRRIINKPLRYQDAGKSKDKRYTMKEVLSILAQDEVNIGKASTQRTEPIPSTKQVDLSDCDVVKELSFLPEDGLRSDVTTHEEFDVTDAENTVEYTIENTVHGVSTIEASSSRPEAVSHCEPGLSPEGTIEKDPNLQTETVTVTVSDEPLLLNIDKLQYGQEMSICIVNNKVISELITKSNVMLDTYQRGSCILPNCLKDIFLACHRCYNFLCYDHIDHCSVCNIDNVINSVISTEGHDENNSNMVLDCLEPGVSDAVSNDESPKKRKRCRKGNPQNWKKNKRKAAHIAGQGYLASTGKVVTAKCVKPCKCLHERKKKYECKSISEEERQELFREYYSCASYERQRDFLKNHTVVSEVVNRTETHASRRKNSVEYYFPAEEKRKRVCKSFFLSTLSLSERVIGYNLKKKARAFIGVDKRGRHPAHNKTPQHQSNEVKIHIESFPTVGPHYTRKDTNRKFLGPELSINKMYDLYVEKMHEKGNSPVHQTVYRRIFTNNYNLSFHHPKKDRCVKCEEYREANDDKRKELELPYSEHQNRKHKARNEKDKDKELSKADNSYLHATFDLQSVLYTPCSNVSTMYYMRKLAVYNFTVYTANGSGYCMVWDETQGHRGSNEIGTSIYKFLKSHVPMFVKHVVLTSDSTVSQNKNQYITRFLLEVVQTLANVQVIEQKFLEPGHTQMEVDSMHSTIECAKKNLKVEVPTDWFGILQSARRKKPYDVSYLTWQDFFDLRGASIKSNRKLNVDTDKKMFNWHKIKSIRVVKGIADKFEIKEDYSEEYRTVLANPASRATRSEKSGAQHSAAKNSIQVIDRKAYLGQQPISEAKKKDLLSLCKSGVISERNHTFYTSLSTLPTVTDNLPVPDISEVDDDVFRIEK